MGVAWEMEPGCRARQENGHSEQGIVEDDHLLDHHNEEVLAAIALLDDSDRHNIEPLLI